jgi:protein-S-isoprenylcysteine O-methyltransferase Ste14
MRRVRAAAGTVVFLVIAPGTVVGLLPWLITGWHSGHTRPAALIAVGAILIAAGCAVLLYAFGQFVIDGLGTPAPPAPTDVLVSRGLYRYVRNPMYLAVLAAILGQASLLARPVLLAYAAAVAAAFVAFVRWYEEPSLRRRYGVTYDEYRERVPGWLPRWPRTGSASGAGRPGDVG